MPFIDNREGYQERLEEYNRKRRNQDSSRIRAMTRMVKHVEEKRYRGTHYEPGRGWYASIGGGGYSNTLYWTSIADGKEFRETEYLASFDYDDRLREAGVKDGFNHPHHEDGEIGVFCEESCGQCAAIIRESKTDDGESRANRV